jgi:hypothetical protein
MSQQIFFQILGLSLPCFGYVRDEKKKELETGFLSSRVL